MKMDYKEVLKLDLICVYREFKDLFRLYPVALSAAFLLLFLTFLHAFLAPSFEPDSLSYHLPRSVHWLVNGSVEFYETAIARQNFQAPLYSMSLAHLIGLTGSDQFFNMIQWFSLPVCAVAVSLIAAELGAGRNRQCFAAIMVLGIPQALSQVIVCVNDLYAATAVMIFLLYLIRLLRRKGGVPLTAFLCAVALGISFVAKYTSLIHVAGFAVPISVAGLIRTWYKHTFRDMFKLAVLLGCIAVAGTLFLTPQVVRNLREYKDPFSGEPPNMMTNTNLTSEKVAVNCLKHLSMHVAFPLYRLNRPLENAVRDFAGDLIEDEDISYKNRWCFTDYRIFTPLGKFSSNASNPVQFLLFCIVVMSALAGGGKKSFFIYSLVPVLCGGILYCTVFKWQPWCARLQLPFFFLMIIGTVLWLAERKHNKALEKVVSFCCLGYALLHVILLPDWYMPAFLYGQLPKASGLDPAATLAQKIRYLNCKGWPSDEIRQMHKSVPPVLKYGYSIFFTDRDRLYIGNLYHDYMHELYSNIQDVSSFLKNRGSDFGSEAVVGLLISSDHGNITSEVTDEYQPPFSREFLLWRAMDNISGQGTPVFKHFAGSTPLKRFNECFPSGKGLILSDGSRESLLKDLKRYSNINCVFSNSRFEIYYVQLNAV
ncbi:MAG: hypothetical protein R6V06_01110 [Kiritimatiellia bacterium]